MRVFNQDGFSTVCPIGIGLELSDASFETKNLKEGTNFVVEVFDIDHFERLHCEVTRIYSHKTYYQIKSKERHVPAILKE